MCERSWEEREILRTYKWANGFTKVSMNRLTMRLGDGCYYGFLYIICGVGIIFHAPLGFILSLVMHNPDWGMSISMLLYFVVGFFIEYICEVQRAKITYNEMIERESQLNLFRDFGLK